MFKNINMLNKNLGYDLNTTNLIINKIWPPSAGNLKYINKSNIDEISYDNFINWFIGFTDGEGSFKTSFRKNINNDISRMTFAYTIYIHADDVETLNLINHKLNLNKKIYIDSRVNKSTRVILNISDKYTLENVIIPIFIKYKNSNNLNTKKYHDFNIWYNIFKLYNDKNISFKDKYNDLLELRNKLNNYNYKHNDNDLNINMDINWYIGFMEGEGSYSVKYSNNKFALISEVSQRDESYKCFIAIKDLLYSLKPNINCKYDIKNKINIVEYPKTNKIKLTISSIDYFYWIYFPNIIKYNWNTRKSIDITLFMISNIILKHGLHYTDEGKELLFKIKNSMNKNRYNNINIIPSINEIINVLSIKPIYDPNKTQDSNSRNIGRKLFIK